ncbi:MAG: sulfite reductase [Chlamydiia bacterium]|nr:sulfite reductase [Chlamydiia bacterium]
MTEYNKENPFPAKIIERYVLNKEGSTKKTYHITLDLAGSKISYRAGDALAIFPENLPEEVNTLLEALNKSGNEEITDPRSGSTLSLEHFLKAKVNLNRIPAVLLKQTGDAKLLEEDNKEARAQFIAKHDLVEFFELYPTNLPLQELVSYFAPLLPRFYSIASSPTVNPHTVDLLVATFSYKHGKKEKEGLGPHYLCHLAAMHTTPIHTYLHPTPHFLLPQDPTTPIIMIGPGTGVAPYRAFLQEREAQKASGKNWLFFGERNQATDYYYEAYFESLKKKDFLSLDLAFSRDQSEKYYVQHRLLEKGDEIWSLLSSGAYLYVCGDARHMAKDVTTALHSIIENHGSQDGKNYLKSLRKEKRLLLDVY